MAHVAGYRTRIVCTGRIYEYGMFLGLDPYHAHPAQLVTTAGDELNDLDDLLVQ